MSREAVNSLVLEIEKQIDYFRKEFELSYAETVGCLEIIKLNIVAEMDDE
jgi:hypothetical protein